MTTTTKAKTCGSCGFATDHMLHYRNCVPTSHWPRELRERKAAAMRGGSDDIMEIDGEAFNAGPLPDEPQPEREPEKVKPMGLSEYRRLHPEANPLTTENMTVREFRKRQDGETDEWDRVIGVREAINQAQPCPRCHRPLLDRAMHITCRPVDGSFIPEAGARDPLKRDDVPLTPRQPKVYTTADVRTGPSWYDSLPAVEEPEADEDEMADFVRPDLDALDSMTPDEAAEEYTLGVDPDVLARVIAEQRQPVSEGASAPASSVLADGQELERSQPSETASCDCGWSGKDIAKHRARSAAHREA